MKIIAWYLSQFHEIPENNEWWGEGFTEWTNVKKGVPLYKGHYQPRHPLNDNYYNLLDKDTIKWQIELARKYGVHGFCIYHYWFGGKLLLEKPVEMFLNDKSLDFPICFCWANESWTNQWVSDKKTVLIEQVYGKREDWINHFNYLLPFFKDDRYIKIDGKPIFAIFNPELVEKSKEMLQFWQELAKKNGFPGIAFAYKGGTYNMQKGIDDSEYDYCIEHEPVISFAGSHQMSISVRFYNSLPQKIRSITERPIRYARSLFYKMTKCKTVTLDYDRTWNEIIHRKPMTKKSIPGAFVDWDNTCRKGNRGTIIAGATPAKFEKYLEKQIIHARDIYKSDMIFMFAWNEWAEAGYLEPDEKYGYQYLEAIKKALINTNEWEQ